MRARDVVAVILAVAVGTSTVAITVAGLWDAVEDPRGVSTTFASLITGTLGVLVGALAGYIGGRHERSESVALEPDPDEHRDGDRR